LLAYHRREPGCELFAHLAFRPRNGYNSRVEYEEKIVTEVAVLCVVIIIMRRNKRKKQQEEEEF
jgi:hypothetical protein